jgi:hypothetical protein
MNSARSNNLPKCEESWGFSADLGDDEFDAAPSQQAALDAFELEGDDPCPANSDFWIDQENDY